MYKYARQSNRTGYLGILAASVFVLLWLLNYTAFAKTAFTDCGINVGIIGDQTGTYDLNEAYSILNNGVQILSQQEVDIVIHVGDLLESRESPDDIRSQYAMATAILDQLPVPWYMTAGDHDVNPPMFQQDSDDRSREMLFQELYGQRVPDVFQRLYYSFDVGSYHFIALYSHEALNADPRWGNIFLAKISDQQLNWLKGDLEAHKHAKAIVVFVHQPLWYNWSAWKPVHNQLKRYPVAVVVSGHFHYNQNEGRIDGIRYVVVGATGGMVKQGNRYAGNVHHVSVMKVRRKNHVGLKLIPVSDNLPLQFTPRVDMDKVQAMAVVLGELWNFGNTNRVFIKNGLLVNDCNSTEPANIQITPIGNPTDKPVTIEVNFSSNDPNLHLTSAGFAPGQCKEVISEYECVMARSARIFFANLSSVMVNTFAGPLWESTLGVTGSDPPQPGTLLNFDVRLTYPGTRNDLYVERRATTTVSNCP